MAAIARWYGAAINWIMNYWIRRIGRQPGPHDLEPFTRAMWDIGQRITAGEYLMAVMDLQAFARRVAGFFTRHDEVRAFR